jgi:uncharacterized protein YcsI (UPF0317 family)
MNTKLSVDNINVVTVRQHFNEEVIYMAHDNPKDCPLEVE